jgi:phage-related protein
MIYFQEKISICFVLWKQSIIFAGRLIDSTLPEMELKVIILEEALDFIKSLPKPVGDKIYDNIHRIESGERNAEIFSKLEGTEIWEFRTLFSKVKYRLFAFWDPGRRSFVIVTHGIIKKTQKTPKKEIEKAERIRKDFLAQNRCDYGTGREI